MHSHQVSDRQLKYFGASLAALLMALAALAYWKSLAPVVGGGLLALAVTLFAVYYLFPLTRRPIYRAFRNLTYPVEWFMTAAILALVYFAVITPIGLVLRLKGIGIRGRTEPQESFWVTRQESTAPASYFRTY